MKRSNFIPVYVLCFATWLASLELCAAAGRVYVVPITNGAAEDSDTTNSPCKCPSTVTSRSDTETCLTMEDLPWVLAAQTDSENSSENGTSTSGSGSEESRGWVSESDTTLVFLPGRHVLNVSRWIVFQHVNNLTLTSESAVAESSTTGSSGYSNGGGADGESRSAPVEIYCAQPAGIFFLNITGLTISNLVITNCGRDSVGYDFVKKAFYVYAHSFFLFESLERMCLSIASVTNLTVSGVTIQNVTGYGLITVNALGYSVIENSTFLFNNFNTYSSSECNGTFTNRDSFFICAGASIALLFVDTPDCIDEENRPTYSFKVSSTKVAYGLNLTPYAVGGGIITAMSQTAYGMHVLMDNVTSMNNTARHGANLAFILYKVVDDSSVTIKDSFIAYSNPLFRPSVLTILSGTQFIGGGLFFGYGQSLPTRFRPSCAVKQRHTHTDLLTVTDTEFVGNSAILGGAMNLAFTQVDANVGIITRIIIENCIFRNNIGSPGSALYVYQLEPIHNTLLTRFLFNNCTFMDNTYPITEIPNSIQQFELDLLNTVQLVSIQFASFVDCRFHDNVGSALYAYASLIRFHGEVEFTRNFGINGGGMSLHGSSLMLLTPNTTITFLNNSAQFRGGGLFISSENYRTTLLCFWQLESMDFHNETGIPLDLVLPTTTSSPSDIINVAEQLRIQVNFRGNRASSSGSAIFGGVIDRCIFQATSDIAGYRDSTRIFNQMFSFSDSKVGTSLISSNPYRICFCNHTTPMCEATNPNITLFPGQTYSLYAVAVGQRNGTSPGVVFGEFISEGKEEDTSAAVKASESAQELGRNCTKLSYTILSTQIGVDLKLLLGLENTNIQRNPTIVTVRLLPCPPGFDLSNDPPSCQCHPFLSKLGIECNITRETVHREPPTWLSWDWEHPTLDNLLQYNYCPYDYCIPNELEHNLSEKNSLCAFNRAGIICGECQQGYSLTLGTNKCEICTSDHLALLIPFAVAGLLLVLVLLLFSSLTVSIGAINGLIFYANIVQVNKDIFFPAGQSNLMTTFIAWLNLDFGIKTCFYDGMDAYGKTLLQFVFPVYVWVLIGVVILLGHYIVSVSKLLGDKGVPVLATVFLLSVVKLQRTIIVALSFANIVHSDGSTTRVWYNDGNIEYLKGKHIYLFVLSLAMLLFLMLPFYFALLFVTCLQALSSYRLFSWVNKSKPLIDAYVGPYKDRHRYWTGFLLFARGIMLIIFSQVEPWVALFVIIVSMQLVSMFTWVGGGVYKKWPINVLEFSFFTNLGILAAATLFIKLNGGYQEGVVYMSVTVAFLEFLGIVAYAVFNQLDSYFGWETSPDCIKEKLSQLLPSLKRKPPTDSDKDKVESISPSKSYSVGSTELNLVINRGDTNSLEGSLSIELREPLLESDRYTA